MVIALHTLDKRNPSVKPVIFLQFILLPAKPPAIRTGIFPRAGVCLELANPHQTKNPKAEPRGFCEAIILNGFR
jgi:hypothetical protein